MQCVQSVWLRMPRGEPTRRRARVATYSLLMDCVPIRTCLPGLTDRSPSAGGPVARLALAGAARDGAEWISLKDIYQCDSQGHAAVCGWCSMDMENERSSMVAQAYGTSIAIANS